MSSITDVVSVAGIYVPQVGNKLMLALGYNEYVAQGGDWGSLVHHPQRPTRSCLNYLTDILHHSQYIWAQDREGLAHKHAIVSIPVKFLKHACPDAVPESALPPRLFSNPLQYLTHMLFPYTESEREGLKRTAWFRDRGSGYFQEQATQPQTIGYALADSPVALLAWIYEKLVNWCDSYKWDDDEGSLSFIARIRASALT